MKIIFLTEGSKKIGFGHITRCLSIYQAFKFKGFDPKFIINADASAKNILKNTNYLLTDWIENKNILYNEIKNTDVLFIDSYLADISVYKKLSNIAKLCVYIDDYERLDYPKGIILNANIHAEKLFLNKKNDNIYLLGTKYIPLRKEFWEIPNKIIKKEVKNIMITFGGDDSKNMTPKILNFFNENYPDFNKYIIIGKAFTNKKGIENIADKNTHLIYYADANKMKETMLLSDIVISAAGQTLYEICATKTPAISITIANNQIGNALGFHEKKLIYYIGNYDDKNIYDNLAHYIEKLKSYDTRKDISNNMNQAVNPKGAIYVTKNILNILGK
jgi:UDP-2,4-diacetamido-2,4,6-trideoxy-beta-L-altropyranose hydrolase